MWSQSLSNYYLLFQGGASVVVYCHNWYDILFVLHFLFTLFRIAICWEKGVLLALCLYWRERAVLLAFHLYWWPSAGKELSSWLSTCTSGHLLGKSCPLGFLIVLVTICWERAVLLAFYLYWWPSAGKELSS